MPDGYRDDNGFSYPEELQMEPDPPRSVRWRWIVLAAVVVVLAVLCL